MVARHPMHSNIGPAETGLVRVVARTHPFRHDLRLLVHRERQRGIILTGRRNGGRQNSMPYSARTQNTTQAALVLQPQSTSQPNPATR